MDLHRSDLSMTQERTMMKTNEESERKFAGTTKEIMYEFLVCLMIALALGSIIGLSGYIGHEKGYREGYQACQCEKGIGKYQGTDIWPGKEK